MFFSSSIRSILLLYVLTEILAFQEKLAESKNATWLLLVAPLILNFHIGLLNTEKKNGGIKGVKFPLVSDLTKTISENYGVLAGEYEVNEAGESSFVGASGCLQRALPDR